MVKVSVIIPVYNEEKYIEKCFDSLSSQTLIPKEIIVVDDGSKDRSLFLVRCWQKRNNLKKVILLEQEHQGVAKARNFGASKARGDILVFIDGDMELEKNYLKEIVKPIMRKKAVATFSSSEYVANLDNLWAKFWDEVTFSNQGKRGAKHESSGETVFRAILKSVFIRTHGYQNYGFTDDQSVLSRTNQQAQNAKQAICYHYNPSTLKEVYYSSRWMGRDKGNLGRLSRFIIFSPLWSVIKAIVGVIRLKDIRFGVFRVIFDWGYFCGLVDVHTRGVHYK